MRQRQYGGGRARGAGPGPEPQPRPPPGSRSALSTLRPDPPIPPIDPGAAAIEALLRLGAATLFGGIIGLNRELRGKPAGLRTHALVSLGAALVVLSSVHVAASSAATSGDDGAISRAVQGIVAGIGFLGGGVILKASDRNRVRYLTTAASIWMAACIGIVCGAGQWSLAGTALLFTLVVLILGGPVEALARRLAGMPAENGDDDGNGNGPAHGDGHAEHRDGRRAAEPARRFVSDDD